MRPLYCDESIWIPVADGLRRRGWTVHTARDEGRLGDPDRDLLSYALKNDRILVTFDDDFLSLVESVLFTFTREGKRHQTNNAYVFAFDPFGDTVTLTEALCLVKRIPPDSEGL